MKDNYTSKYDADEPKNKMYPASPDSTFTRWYNQCGAEIERLIEKYETKS